MLAMWIFFDGIRSRKMGITIKQLYDNIVRNINEIDKMSEYLRGKHDAYNDVRLDLFNMIQQDNEVENGNVD